MTKHMRKLNRMIIQPVKHRRVHTLWPTISNQSTTGQWVSCIETQHKLEKRLKHVRNKLLFTTEIKIPFCKPFLWSLIDTTDDLQPHIVMMPCIGEN